MKWINKKTEEKISNHQYKKLSEEEKMQYYREEIKDTPGNLINVLGGGLLGGDSDDET